MMTHDEWSKIADSLFRAKPVYNGRESLEVYFQRFGDWMTCCKNVSSAVRSMTGQE